MEKPMSDRDPPPLRQAGEDFRWTDVALRQYKEDNAAPFKTVSRQVLFSDPRMQGELRYFEVDADGYSTLERHEHMHAVMILRGAGRVLVGELVYEVGPHDLVTIPPWTWHQFRPVRGDKLGFLCMVSAERDRPQLPSAEEMAALRADPKVAAFLDGADGARS
jgi:mannose-6-phosphate isomerase-like protein (cupin superfamily)